MNGACIGGGRVLFRTWRRRNNRNTRNAVRVFRPMEHFGATCCGVTWRQPSQSIPREHWRFTGMLRMLRM
jgi:hypothetical protein